MTVLNAPPLVRPGLPLVELLVRQQDLLRGGWLAAQLDDVLRLGPRRLVVDLSRCSWADCDTLRALLRAHQHVRESGGQLVLRGICPRLTRVISRCGLRDVFELEGPVPR